MEIKDFITKRDLSSQLQELVESKGLEYKPWLHSLIKLFSAVPPDKVHATSADDLENILVRIAESGADPSPTAGHVYLVPRKGKLILQEGYKFVLHLLHEAGYHVVTQVIKQGEMCRVVVKNGVVDIEHEFNPGDRDKVIVGAYAIITSLVVPNIRHVCIVDKQELERLKAAAISGDSEAWKLGPETMAKKAAIHRIRHVLPIRTLASTEIHHVEPNQPVSLKLLNDMYSQLKLTADQIDALESKFNGDNKAIFEHLKTNGAV